MDRLAVILVVAVVLAFSAAALASPDLVRVGCPSGSSGIITWWTGPLSEADAPQNMIVTGAFGISAGTYTSRFTWNSSLWYAFYREYKAYVSALSVSTGSWALSNYTVFFTYSVSLVNQTAGRPVKPPWTVNRAETNIGGQYGSGITGVLFEDTLKKASGAVATVQVYAWTVTYIAYGGTGGASYNLGSLLDFSTSCYQETSGGGGGGGGSGSVTLTTTVSGCAEISPSPGSYSYSKGSVVTVMGRPTTGASWYGMTVYWASDPNSGQYLSCTWRNGWCVATLTMSESAKVVASAGCPPAGAEAWLNITTPLSLLIVNATITDPEGNTYNTALTLTPRGWLVGYSRSIPNPTSYPQCNKENWKITLTPPSAASNFTVRRYWWDGRLDGYPNPSSLTGASITVSVEMGKCMGSNSQIYSYATFTFTNGTKSISTGACSAWWLGCSAYSPKDMLIVQPLSGLQVQASGDFRPVVSGASLPLKANTTIRVNGASYTVNMNGSAINLIFTAGSSVSLDANSSVTPLLTEKLNPRATCFYSNGQYVCYNYILNYTIPGTYSGVFNLSLAIPVNGYVTSLRVYTSTGNLLYGRDDLYGGKTYYINLTNIALNGNSIRIYATNYYDKFTVTYTLYLPRMPFRYWEVYDYTSGQTTRYTLRSLTLKLGLKGLRATAFYSYSVTDFTVSAYWGLTGKPVSVNVFEGFNDSLLRLNVSALGVDGSPVSGTAYLRYNGSVLASASLSGGAASFTVDPSKFAPGRSHVFYVSAVDSNGRNRTSNPVYLNYYSVKLAGLSLETTTGDVPLASIGYIVLPLEKVKALVTVTVPPGADPSAVTRSLSLFIGRNSSGSYTPLTVFYPVNYTVSAGGTVVNASYAAVVKYDPAYVGTSGYVCLNVGGVAKPLRGPAVRIGGIKVASIESLPRVSGTWLRVYVSLLDDAGSPVTSIQSYKARVGVLLVEVALPNGAVASNYTLGVTTIGSTPYLTADVFVPTTSVTRATSGSVTVKYALGLPGMTPTGDPASLAVGFLIIPVEARLKSLGGYTFNMTLTALDPFTSQPVSVIGSAVVEVRSSGDVYSAADSILSASQAFKNYLTQLRQSNGIFIAVLNLRVNTG